MRRRARWGVATTQISTRVLNLGPLGVESPADRLTDL